MAKAKQRFGGKVVLITGASGGQGRVQARMFAEQGAAVVLTDVLDGPGKQTAALIRDAGGSAAYFNLDVTAAARLADDPLRAHARLAGVLSGPSTRLGRGPVGWVRAATPAMPRRESYETADSTLRTSSVTAAAT